jgi:hypothetical protein
LVAAARLAPVRFRFSRRTARKDVNRLIALFGCVPYLGLRSLFYGRFIRAHLSRDFLRFYSPLGALGAVAEQVAPSKLSAMPQVNVDRFMATVYDLPAEFSR